MNVLNAAQRMRMIEKFETLTMNEYEALNSEIEQLRQRVQELEASPTMTAVKDMIQTKALEENEYLSQRVQELEQQLTEVRRAERERVAQMILNGRFLHDESPAALFAKEVAAAIRAME